MSEDDLPSWRTLQLTHLGGGLGGTFLNLNKLLSCSWLFTEGKHDLPMEFSHPHPTKPELCIPTQEGLFIVNCWGIGITFEGDRAWIEGIRLFEKLRGCSWNLRVKRMRRLSLGTGDQMAAHEGILCSILCLSEARVGDFSYRWVEGPRVLMKIWPPVHPGRVLTFGKLSNPFSANCACIAILQRLRVHRWCGNRKQVTRKEP